MPQPAGGERANHEQLNIALDVEQGVVDAGGNVPPVARPQPIPDPFEAVYARVVAGDDGRVVRARYGYQNRAQKLPAKIKVGHDIPWDALIRHVYNIQMPDHPSQKDMDEVFQVKKLIYEDDAYKWVNKKGGVGIEVEIERVLSVHDDVCRLIWKGETDGSLRNHGLEFKTRGPIPLSYVQPALRLLFNGLNPGIDFSQRTSVHIHMDARGMSLDQILSLLSVYTVAENLLFKFAGNNRRSNIFCVPITETLLYDGLAAATPASFVRELHESWYKYTALNLHSLSKFGTVEFRHMPGTNNINTLLIWCDLIHCLKTYAYRYSRQEILNQIKRLNTTSGYIDFLEVVFGPLLRYLDTSRLKHDMEKGVYLVKNFNVSNEFDASLRQMGAHPESSLLQALGGVIKEAPKSLKHKLGEDNFRMLKDIGKRFAPLQSLEETYASIMRSPAAWVRAGVNRDSIQLLVNQNPERTPF